MHVAVTHKFYLMHHHHHHLHKLNGVSPRNFPFEAFSVLFSPFPFPSLCKLFGSNSQSVELSSSSELSDSCDIEKEIRFIRVKLRDFQLNSNRKKVKRKDLFCVHKEIRKFAFHREFY